jgi:hypothetical protein
MPRAGAQVPEQIPDHRERHDQQHAHDRAAADAVSSDHRIHKSDAYRVVFSKPFFGGILGGEDVEVVDIADLWRLLPNESTALPLGLVARM